MPDLPSGTVTFLFTDIEGSTRLWERDAAAMRGGVARHLAILRDAIEAQGGVLFKTVGDSVQAAFRTASDALAAAVAAQRALSAEPWPDPPGRLAIRIALHAGAASPTEGDYLAPALNRLARLLAAGHGGQVLLTETVRGLLDGAPPDGSSLRDLGQHRLRDLQQPERIWQAVGVGLPDDFPPLRSLDTHPHNLPTPPTPLIGREAELAEVFCLIATENARLVTVTGSGGSGKTRLALEAASELLDSFPDGVWLVDLARLTDPDLLLGQIATAIGLRASGEQALERRLTDYLAGQRLLLVLDNFEQFRPFDAAARTVAELLTAAPHIAILATSRAPLRLRVERELPLSPLPVPSPRETAVESLAQSPSVRLFLARAQAVRPDFELGPHNAAAIAALCRRLDGLPLALELAAARVRVLAPADILARLGDRLDLLADRGVDRPDRQRTLEATVAWSYDLLPPEEQTAFRQLSVFAGGFTLEQAEALFAAGLPGLDALDAVATLIDQGLLKVEEQPGATLRYRMLETVRIFALDRLRACGEEQLLRQAHVDLVRLLVESADAAAGQTDATWLDRLEVEHDNVRAALEWMLRERSPDALTLAADLWRFWWPRGYWTEARVWIERALANDVGAPSLARARALRALGLLLDTTGDRQRGLTLLEETLQIARDIGHRETEWQTLLDLSLLWAARDYREAGRYADLALTVARELDDPPRIARSLNRLGNWQLNRESPQEALVRHREALAILERIGDQEGIAETLDLLGMTSGMAGDTAGASSWYARAVDAWRAMGDRHGLAASLVGRAMIGHTYHTDTIPVTARAEEVNALGEEGLALSREIGWRAGEAFALWSFRGMGLGARGDYASALTSTQEGLAIALEIEHGQWITGARCMLGNLHADLYDWTTARRELESALTLAQEIDSLYWVRSSAGWLASTLTRSADIPAALDVLDNYWTIESPADSIASRILWTARVELALAQGNFEQTLQLTDRLTSRPSGERVYPIPRLDLLRATALIHLDRLADADAALTAARLNAAWSGARPLLWRIDAARSRLYRRWQRPAEADAARTAAAALVKELAAGVPDGPLRTSFLTGALADIERPS
jgi:predicted ATPase/class 3 adenylate cyclase